MRYRGFEIIPDEEAGMERYNPQTGQTEADVYKRQEELRTKDFFDCILPGTIKFLSDHYILGDNYCCVWVIREYPPSTEEQAILSQLADRSGVTLRIYHRLVEAMEQRKICLLYTSRNGTPLTLYSP